MSAQSDKFVHNPREQCINVSFQGQEQQIVNFLMHSPHDQKWQKNCFLLHSHSTVMVLGHGYGFEETNKIYGFLLLPRSSQNILIA